MSDVAIAALKQQMRSTEKVRMVRETKLANGTIHLIDAWLPIGRGWNQGNGITDLINSGAGWIPYDKYMADKHQKEVEAKRLEEAKAEAPVVDEPAKKKAK